MNLRQRFGVLAACACLLIVASLHGGDAVPVLMGYDHLDSKGLPEHVRVALTHAKLTELWQRAHPDDVKVAPVCSLATGAADYSLTLSESGLSGELSLPLAVLGEQWQQVHIPVLPGSVREVLALPLAGGKLAAGTLTWTCGEHDLVVSVAPQRQCVVLVVLALPVTESDGAWSAEFPVLPSHGGKLTITDARRELWLPVIAGKALAPPVAEKGPWTWTIELAPAQPSLTLQFRRPDAATPRDFHLALDQRARVGLAPGRLEWQDELQIVIQGGTVREAHLTLPAGLTLTTMEGPGLAAWRQQGAEADLAWSSPQSGTISVRASGVMTRAAGAGSAEVLLHLKGAERNLGRMDLVHGAVDHFLRPDHPRLERAEPIGGADLAARWSDDPERAMVSWEPVTTELRLVQECALVAGLDRLRATAICALSGHGSADALILRLPEPWRLVGTPSGATVVFRGAGVERRLVARGDGPWKNGARVLITVEAERQALIGQVTAPDFSPVGDGIGLDHQAWVFGDAGDRRLRLDNADQFTVANVDALAATLARSGVSLRAGEQWRVACERRTGVAPQLSLLAEGAQVRVSASHYLVLGQERVRWWAHLVYDVEQGELRELRCTLPAGSQLTRLTVADLGSWERHGDEVVAHLAAPTRRAVALELELETPLAKTEALLNAITTPAGQILFAQQVAFVEEDDLGLVHLDPKGLEDNREDQSALPLPEGVDAKLVNHRWRAQRPDWQLGIRREVLATTSGVDGVATLVDAVSVIAPDGDSRGRAVWHVLNRTRQQLSLRLPPGVELWEARVNGRLVRPRLDNGDMPALSVADRHLWLPVRPQRPGEAALRLEVTWRQRVDATRTFTPLMPVFTELRLLQTLWRFMPPPGYEVSRSDGELKEGRAGDAEADRARCVIEELQRLRSVGDLNDAGLRRLGDQLAVLDLELNDYLVGMQQMGGNQALVQAATRIRQQPHQAQPPAINAPANAEYQAQQEVISAVNSNRNQVQQELKRIEQLSSDRASRRGALGLDNNSQSWKGIGYGAAQQLAAPRSGDFIARFLPQSMPWRDALTVAANGSLGPGEAPPGYRSAGGGSLLGLDLIVDQPGNGLTLRGQGSDLAVELRLRRHPGAWWPWLLLAGAAACVAVGVLRRRR